jgi:hypothetical protein
MPSRTKVALVGLAFVTTAAAVVKSACRRRHSQTYADKTGELMQLLEDYIRRHNGRIDLSDPELVEVVTGMAATTIKDFTALGGSTSDTPEELAKRYLDFMRTFFLSAPGQSLFRNVVVVDREDDEVVDAEIVKSDGTLDGFTREELRLLARLAPAIIACVERNGYFKQDDLSLFHDVQLIAVEFLEGYRVAGFEQDISPEDLTLRWLGLHDRVSTQEDEASPSNP